MRLRGLNKYKYESELGARNKDLLPEVNRAALARACGYSRAEISRVLSGKGRSAPSLRMLRALADALECSLDEVDEFLRELKRNGKRGGQ